MRVLRARVLQVQRAMGSHGARRPTGRSANGGLFGRILRLFALAVMFVTVSPLRGQGPAPAQPPPIELRGLADGPYARMEGKLQRTIFQIPILRVGVRVDPETQHKLAAIARGRDYSDARAQRAARAMLEAQDVLIVVEFQRTVSFERFMRAIQGDIRRAWEADLIPDADYQQISQALPEWFAPIEGRGMRAGDLLIYRLHPDSLRTRFMSAEGEIFIDRLDPGAVPRRTFLASYFAPDTRLRRALLQSLFD
jgi:hypothetical protein